MQSRESVEEKILDILGKMTREDIPAVCGSLLSSIHFLVSKFGDQHERDLASFNDFPLWAYEVRNMVMARSKEGGKQPALPH